ncbi:u43-Liphistoxin-Lth1a_1 [Caerostris darwini]|uniref:U43-Liphistoxin-Lth1a_1 n=1 Tax=Caerostris darwini TaxID=1538125 RepID=A0AAV4UBL0_9ARAC|nr:u43-Liphistoxin-Lth1a_1 [Caerostris darwini]
MNCVQAAVQILVTLWLMAGYNNGQDIIIFENGRNTSRNNLAANVTIPEKLLIRMKDVVNVTDLLNRFVRRIDSSDDEESAISGRRSNARAPSIDEPAMCEPEQQVVELEKPGHGAVLLWPPCVRVRRCGGCCTSKLLTCSPIATSLYNVSVLRLQYNFQTPDAFESLGTRIISVEQHDRCACKCKQDANSCSDVQRFSEDECQCVCINRNEASECTGHRRIWDSIDCACKCRRIMNCSTGNYFNPLRCRCESSRRL